MCVGLQGAWAAAPNPNNISTYIEVSKVQGEERVKVEPLRKGEIVEYTMWVRVWGYQSFPKNTVALVLPWPKKFELIDNTFAINRQVRGHLEYSLDGGKTFTKAFTSDPTHIRVRMDQLLWAPMSFAVTWQAKSP